MAKTTKKTQNTENAVMENVITDIMQVQPPEPFAMVEEIQEIAIDPTGKLVDTGNVLHSSSLVKNNITYPSPEILLRPVISLLGAASEIRCAGENEIEISNGENSYKAFQRFNVIAKFEVDTELFYEVGCLVALDLAVPKIKVYTGAVVAACLNLSVMAHDSCVKFDLNSNNATDTVKLALQEIGEKIKKTKEIINRLKAITLSPEVTQQMIGALAIGNAAERSNFGANFFSQGVQLIAEESSKYYHKAEGFNAWQLYNAFTENIKKANVFDVADKSKDFYKLIAQNTAILN